MDLSLFHYDLPQDRIAQQPLEDRAASRMLVVDRAGAKWEDRSFRDLPEYLAPGDCLVLNDSKVLPARLFGRRVGLRSLPVGKRNPKRREHLSGQVEVLLLHPITEEEHTWLVLARPGRKLHCGERLLFSEKLEAVIIARGEFGVRTLRFECDGNFHETVAEIGHVPLPPYIDRLDTSADQTRYQTVYARAPGSVAAPTAGLHFTTGMLDACQAAGAVIARVTLHVGLGTFQPLRSANVEETKLHAERFEIAPQQAACIQAAQRVVAVGTTSVRTIETAAAGRWQRLAGGTDLFIYPGYRFQRVDAMLTNFHLPQSSLLLLVCAFGGTDLILEVYRHAVASGYRFYSYGDAMLIV
jgi:S-adenosylmethionine:tRNA ribosyltransferase-isomerase